MTRLIPISNTRSSLTPKDFEGNRVVIQAENTSSVRWNELRNSSGETVEWTCVWPCRFVLYPLQDKAVYQREKSL